MFGNVYDTVREATLDMWDRMWEKYEPEDAEPEDVEPEDVELNTVKPNK